MFVLNGEELVEMHEQPHDSKHLLQMLLAKHKNLRPALAWASVLHCTLSRPVILHGKR
jgi:hypothetical protein